MGRQFYGEQPPWGTWLQRQSYVRPGFEPRWSWLGLSDTYHCVPARNVTMVTRRSRFEIRALVVWGQAHPRRLLAPHKLEYCTVLRVGDKIPRSGESLSKNGSLYWITCGAIVTLPNKPSPTSRGCSRTLYIYIALWYHSIEPPLVRQRTRFQSHFFVLSLRYRRIKGGHNLLCSCFKYICYQTVS